MDVFPLTLVTVSAALEGLGKRGQNIIPVFISVDPERDTPEVLEEYIERFSPRIVGLIGSEPQLQPRFEGVSCLSTAACSQWFRLSR
ncbi:MULTISPECIES: SCO family protein [Acetobacter]|uniref:SCO family protein n=1 Tax=Acetobacter TaxID=434 RepID=UPI0026867CFF|nr:SCO family protein [Acetobacter pomorum]